MARTRSSVTIIALAMAVTLVAGCTSAVQATMTHAETASTSATGTVAPTATLTQEQQLVFGQELFNLGCVCHPTSQEGAPPVSQIESLPASTIEQTVRQGRSPMPMWDTQQLSDQWLNYIVAYLQAIHQGTPVPTVAQETPMPTATP